jgi:hypothetical protein
MMISVASMAELRENQRVRVDLYKGQTVRAEDYETARKVIAQVLWNRPLALFMVIVGCAWLFLALFGHGSIQWVAIALAITMPLNAWGLLQRRKRILNGAAKMTPPLI